MMPLRDLYIPKYQVGKDSCFAGMIKNKVRGWYSGFALVFRGYKTLIITFILLIECVLQDNTLVGG